MDDAPAARAKSGAWPRVGGPHGEAIRRLACGALVLAACGARGPSVRAAAGGRGTTWPTATAGGPKDALTVEEARRYMVQLINRDRASVGMKPVVLDEGAPTRAGQGHAEDMARFGYVGHWGTDGSVPEQRYTEAGGADMVLENASCVDDEQRRALDPAPRVDRQTIEQAEDAFFHERPPHDGHRKNILGRWHQRVGIGVALPVASPTEIVAPCFSQEFVDRYGSYAPLPQRVRLGATLRVSGTVSPPATLAGVGLARAQAPGPLSIHELNRRRSYRIPAPYRMAWRTEGPAGEGTPVSGRRFSVDLPVSDHGKRGLYELSVWASMPGARSLVMVSLRTVQVR